MKGLFNCFYTISTKAYIVSRNVPVNTREGRFSSRQKIKPLTVYSPSSLVLFNMLNYPFPFSTTSLFGQVVRNRRMQCAGWRMQKCLIIPLHPALCVLHSTFCLKILRALYRLKIEQLSKNKTVNRKPFSVPP